MKKLLLAFSLSIACFVSNTTHAHPYASGVTNNAGTIQFRLNEPADNVYVVFEDNTTNTISGVNTKGVKSFALGSHTSYKIYVQKTGTGNPSLISADTNQFNIWNSPRGVAVNFNPKVGSLFGRVYVANSAVGGTAPNNKGKGLYALNSDFTEALGRGTTASLSSTFSAATASQPWRLAFNPDDNSVLIADFSTAAATVWMADAGLNTPTQVLGIVGQVAGQDAGIHGEVCSVYARGTIANGNFVLWTADESLRSADTNSSTPGSYNNLNRYDIGSGPLPWSSAPNLAINLGLTGTQADIPMDVDADPNGNIYGGFNRADKTAPCLQVFAAGTYAPIYSSLDTFNNIEVITNGSYTMRVSPDGKYVACMTQNNFIYVMGIVNGLPDPSTLFTIPNTSSTISGRNIAWDAADNLYEISSGQALLRCYSLGLTTTAITSNDSTGNNGTFSLVIPPYNVTLQATTPFASQNYGSPTPGVFTLTRSGGDMSKTLTVNFTLTGTATNGTYTTPVTTNVTFAANQTTTNINITPTATPVIGPTMTVVMTIQPSQAYVVTPPPTATVFIQNTGPQYAFVSRVVAPGTMYRGHTADSALYVVTRWGDTNPPSGSYDVTMNYSGSAVLGTDYLNAAPTVTINPGDATVVGVVSQPVKNTTYSGDKTITVKVASGSGYTAGTNTANLTLLDNIYPPETVLWSDSLNNDTSANWTTLARNTNGPSTDYVAAFATLLGNDFVGNAPNGSPTALKVTCNKNAPPPTGFATGLNMFPTGKTFSNNFAFRFDMNLVQGSTFSSATESALFGINHAGNNVNWLNSSAAGTGSADGVWCTISSDGGGAASGDFFEFTAATLRSAVSGANFTNAFKHPDVYTSVNSTTGIPNVGVPANSTGLANEWSAVEIKQSNNVVTVSVDRTPIIVYTNTTAFTSGAVMLGYDDPFASVGSTGAAYYSNARVVDLGSTTIVAPRITSVTVNGATVVINFTTSATGDTTSAFALQSVSTVNGTFADVSPAATITGGSGAFQATIPVAGATQFYRIRHN